MDQEETIALFEQGREAWNAWAEGMLAKRKRLEEAGQWGSGIDTLSKRFGLNYKTQNWLEEATANFSGACFFELKELIKGYEFKSAEGHSELVRDIVEGVDFVGFIFPGDVYFVCNEFPSDLSFAGSKFRGDVFFLRTKFEKHAAFSKVEFLESAHFFATIFIGEASFNGTKFRRSAHFHGTQFFEKADFIGATFSGNVGFFGAQFNGLTDFSSCIFEQSVDLRQTSFAEETSFQAMKSCRAFTFRATKFNQAPNFLQADFATPPTLDDIEIKFPIRYCMPAIGDEETNVAGKNVCGLWCAVAKEDHRYLRALRKLTDDGGDHLQSMNFFADEIRARRHWVDLPGGPGMARYYFGWAYQFVSDFGRSFARPFGWWLASIVMFAGFYAGLAIKPADWWAAGYLSVRHALVVGGLTRSGKLNEVLARLFGAEDGVVKVPDGAGFVMLAQPVVSAVFLFFMALALRNHFKIGR